MATAKRVLILDDSPVVLTAARMALESVGLQALLAEDLAALERQMREQPDLLVIDVNMPEAYGDDLSMILREVRDSKVPILLFSSLGEEELAERARRAGVDGYVCKSAGIEGLVRRVQEILS